MQTTTTATSSIRDKQSDCNQLGREGKQWRADQGVFAAVVVGLGGDERRRHALDECGHLGARKAKEAIDGQLRARRGQQGYSVGATYRVASRTATIISSMWPMAADLSDPQPCAKVPY